MYYNYIVTVACSFLKQNAKEQVRQRVQTLTQKHQANLEYLRAKNDQCKRRGKSLALLLLC